MKSVCRILTLFAATLVFDVSPVFADSAEKALHDIVTIGNREFTFGNFSSAEKIYLKALEKSKDSMEVNFNYACALYKVKRYDYALKHFNRAFEKADFDTRSKIFFNTGNTYFKLDQLGKAIKMYKEALRLNPHDEASRHNLALSIKKRKELNMEGMERVVGDEGDTPETEQGSFISAVSEVEDEILGEKMEQLKNDITSGTGGTPEPLGKFVTKYKEMTREDMEKLLKSVAKDDMDVLKEYWRVHINHSGGVISKQW